MLNLCEKKNKRVDQWNLVRKGYWSMIGGEANAALSGIKTESARV